MIQSILFQGCSLQRNAHLKMYLIIIVYRRCIQAVPYLELHLNLVPLNTFLETQVWPVCNFMRWCLESRPAEYILHTYRATGDANHPFGHSCQAEQRELFMHIFLQVGLKVFRQNNPIKTESSLNVGICQAYSAKSIIAYCIANRTKMNETFKRSDFQFRNTLLQ